MPPKPHRRGSGSSSSSSEGPRHHRRHSRSKSPRRRHSRSKSPHRPHSKSPPPPHEKHDDKHKKDDEVTKMQAMNLQTQAAPAYTLSSAGNAKPAHTCTALFGNASGGKEFDHGKRVYLVEITVAAGAAVDSITVKYGNGDVLKQGGGGGEKKSLFLANGEYINQVVVRAGKTVQCLTFTTNKGRTLGPCGGKGGLLLGKCGEETTLHAPNGCALVSIKGRSGDFLDAIAFYWGPIEH
mmetsp:Transcript_24387/g.34961  ORF Transcript_24387/g.34961 Transcript_24387/m.34961 type:complete len:238 (-) Transcript_24387:154-867(-)|eukprot:CAMPEP_0172423408 /NCGR_PEP_ID=MMETSP1064-20121228/16060_1 /TAXON_ID=202472 /ORGANISM="Aulacoseira subarctica , Strain CCAP 1002/5" /LENGTH=237 /DNA_ID=CAMNT_0013164777 /DNA_START=113 /DNA_END=826 /DNA_ORIENTATION=+